MRTPLCLTCTRAAFARPRQYNPVSLNRVRITEWMEYQFSRWKNVSPGEKSAPAVVVSNSKTLPRIPAPAQTLLKLTQNSFDHYKVPDLGYNFRLEAKQWREPRPHTPSLRASATAAGGWAQRGFSPVDLLNLWEPTGAWEEYPGLIYGEGPRQKLDVYKPRHAAKAPVVVFFYGGSWQGGSRDLYPFVGASLAAQGIVTVVPDYSIFPPARFPTFVEDAARAVRFARASAAQWGGDPSRLVLMGHSAGAYIAAMLSFDPQWLGQVGLNSQTDLAGFIGLAGPYDFLPIESRTLRTIFGGANRTETQPISFVTGKEAPALLITARRDRLVSPGNSRRMAAQDSRPWRCCRGTDLWRGRSSYVDRRLCARFASSGAGAARRHSIRLARHKQAGQFSQQSLGTMIRHARRNDGDRPGQAELWWVKPL